MSIPLDVLRLSMTQNEGDLGVALKVDRRSRVTQAWCVATVFRGFERVFLGMIPTDVLALTMRICGICSTSHQLAAIAAIENAMGVAPAPQAVRVRNFGQAAETLSGYIRFLTLTFLPHLADPAFRDQPLYDMVTRAFAPMWGGRVARAAHQLSISALGALSPFSTIWPHGMWVAPGGITPTLTIEKLAQAEAALNAFEDLYAREFLGCNFERWRSVRSADQLDAWLDERAEHQRSAVGLFLRMGRSIGLDRLGVQPFGASGLRLLSWGSYFDPSRPGHPLKSGGYLHGTRVDPFDQRKFLEHTWSSHYQDGPPTHPWYSQTIPDANRGYSYAKATSYAGHPVQLGPVADLLLGGDPLIASLLEKYGLNSMLRVFARMHQVVEAIDTMRLMLKELKEHLGEPTIVRPDEPFHEGQGFGAVNATRGTLCYWIKVAGGKVVGWQIITPTSANASPRNSWGQPGPWESLLRGVLVDPLNPIWIKLLIHSFDACLVCTVHSWQGDGRVIQLVETGHLH